MGAHNVKKYILYPGPITSRSDGQEHFIHAAQLANLYRVRLSECEVMHDDLSVDETKLKERLWKDLIPLFPRYHGNYEEVPTLTLSELLDSRGGRV